MNKPTTDFISLPEDFKLRIFKGFDWKSLINLKLVDFCSEDEYESLLRKIDLTVVEEFSLNNFPDQGSIMVKCKNDFSGNFHVYTFSASLTNGKDFNNYLTITIEGSRKFGVI
uniref:F-box domain-containing protein n=1 Tax=Strongyloides papillosus TaxID=174720 RepID=A0A0N5BGZ1_STREA